MATPIVNALSIPRCVTIDRAPHAPGYDDKGALEGDRIYFSGSAANSTPHEAIMNLVNCSRGKHVECIIAGHGQVGAIACGGGVHPTDDQLIAEYVFWNHWKDDIAGLRGQATMVTLFACETGASSWGLRLLDSISKLTGVVARAPTGMVACTGQVTMYEPGSVMQVVIPGQPLPQPIEVPPTPNYPPWSDPPSARLRLLNGQHVVELGANHIETLEVVHAHGYTFHLSGMQLAKALSFIRFAYPIDMGAPLMSIASGTVILHPTVEGRTLLGSDREFIICGQRYLMDAAYPSIVYRVDPPFDVAFGVLQRK